METSLTLLRYTIGLSASLLAAAPSPAQTHVSVQSTISIPSLLCQVGYGADSDSFHLKNRAAPADSAVAQRLEIAGVRMAGKNEIEVAVWNAGPSQARLEGSVALCGADGEEAARIPISSLVVESGRRRTVRAMLPVGLRRGRYLAVPVVDFGGAYVAAARTRVQVR